MTREKQQEPLRVHGHLGDMSARARSAPGRPIRAKGWAARKERRGWRKVRRQGKEVTS